MSKPGEARRQTDRNLPLRWITIAAGLPLVVYAVHLALFADHVNDDAYITFRYSASLADGRGPYSNPGEHVEGYTNFLWMLALAVVSWIADSAVPAFARIAGAIAGGAALLAGFGTALCATREWPAHWRLAAATGAASLVATFPGFALNATSGLETGLFAALIAGALWLAAAERSRAAGTLWALAVLTRPEAIVVFGAWWCVRFMGTARYRGLALALRSHAPEAAIVGGLVFLQLVLRWFAYDAELLPNTYWAKAGGYLGVSPIDYLLEGGVAACLGPIGLTLGVLGTVWLAPRSSGQTLIETGVVGTCGLALPFVMGTDWMPGWRFAVPYLLPLAVVIATGWVCVARAASERFDAPLSRWVAGLFVAAVLATGLVRHAEERKEFSALLELRAAAFETGHRALASWITGGAVPIGEKIALMDIGFVGYAAREHRILDISGLTDRTIARSPGGFLAKQYDASYVFDQKPALIVIALSAPGAPQQPLPGDQPLRALTQTEHRLLSHADFERHYRRAGSAPAPGADWLERIAARIGAARVFAYRLPDRHYLLAAYLREPDSETRPATLPHSPD